MGDKLGDLLDESGDVTLTDFAELFRTSPVKVSEEYVEKCKVIFEKYIEKDVDAEESMTKEEFQECIKEIKQEVKDLSEEIRNFKANNLA